MKSTVISIARITLFAFLLNVLLPFFAVYNAQPTVKPLAVLLGDKILICSEDGFKWVKRQELQNGAGKHTSHYQCPLCYLAAHGMKDVITPTAMQVVRVAAAENAPYRYTYHAIDFRLPSSLYSRAPPASFFS